MSQHKGNPKVQPPTLANGDPWPLMTRDVVEECLLRRPGRDLMAYVPFDSVGPMLVGSDGERQYPQPPGYDSVRLSGSLRLVRSRNDAEQILDAALELAASNDYSDILVGAAYSTAETAGQSPLKCDVLGLIRPGREAAVEARSP